MDINQLRGEIDAIDNELLELFQRRMELAAKIGRYKKEHSLPIKDPQREHDILNKIVEKARPELAQQAKLLFSALFEISSDYQAKINTDSK